MARKDHYYNKSKQEGYRSRAAYKLKQLDATASLIDRGDTVVDLGAAPGGWVQVAAERVGPDGRVIGVDRQRIDPVDGVETIRGDVTEDATVAELRDRLGDRGADLVLSDMAPNMTGEYSVDHARSIHLAQSAFAVAKEVLTVEGDFVVKVFDGPDVEELVAALEPAFDYVQSTQPAATRDESSELYLIGKRHITAPVREGDTLMVEIVDVGEEGDGLAKIDGFTVFVPGTTKGDHITARIVDVKPRFAFGERIESHEKNSIE